MKIFSPDEMSVENLLLIMRKQFKARARWRKAVVKRAENFIKEKQIDAGDFFERLNVLNMSTDDIERGLQGQIQYQIENGLTIDKERYLNIVKKSYTDYVDRVNELINDLYDYYKNVCLYLSKPFKPIAQGQIFKDLTIYAGNATDKINNGEFAGKDRVTSIMKILPDKKQARTFGITTMKLLDRATVELTKRLLEGAKYNGGIPLKAGLIVFPLRQFAIECGKDIQLIRATRPKERIKSENDLDHFQRVVKADLALLQNIRLTWTENIDGKERKFDHIRIIEKSKVSLKGDYITITFAPEFVEYLEMSQMRIYPTKLLQIENRAYNAYKIARMFTIPPYDSERGYVSNIVGVRDLLNITSLYGIDERRNVKNSWLSRIIPPFEDSLNVIKKLGIIESWDYVDTDKTSLDKWAQGKIKYTLENKKIRA